MRLLYANTRLFSSRAPESLIPVLEQLCTVLEQLCQVEADKLTVISADHPDQLESLLNDENMLLLQLRGLDKKRSDLLRRSGLEGLTFRQILMQEDSEAGVSHSIQPNNFSKSDNNK